MTVLTFWQWVWFGAFAAGAIIAWGAVREFLAARKREE